MQVRNDKGTQGRKGCPEKKKTKGPPGKNQRARGPCKKEQQCAATNRRLIREANNLQTPEPKEKGPATPNMPKREEHEPDKKGSDEGTP